MCSDSLAYTLAILSWALLLIAPQEAHAQVGENNRAFTVYFLGELDLQLEDATQKVISLRARDNGFDYAPGEWMVERADSGFYHLGDLTLQTRIQGSQWADYSSAHSRVAPELLPAAEGVLAAADISAVFEGSGLRIRRYWETLRGSLGLRFELMNSSTQAIEIGALGIPMVFNNIMHERSLDKAHTVNSFHDPYIGLDAGYVQVIRLDGKGPVLLVTPQSNTPFEAWRPLLDDRTPRGITHEGFYEWMPHSLSYAESEWVDALPWNEPTSYLLQPGEERSYGLRFSLAEDVRHIEDELARQQLPVAVGLPGYVLPQDSASSLFLSSRSPVKEIEVDPEGALLISRAALDSDKWQAYDVAGLQWGRARVTLTYEDDREQTVHYKVIKPAADVVNDMGRFLTTKQWFDDANDPFGRAPSVISYDWTAQEQVTQDNRVWIAGLGDEGGSGAWLTAAMKQHIQPNLEEIQKMERFVDETLWGGLQYSDGALKYGVRKSLFYYAPDDFPEGTYSEDVPYGGWESWSQEHAKTVGRSFNYPHVAALYWTMYRLARNNVGLVNAHDWAWYLEKAYATSEAMVRLAPEYAEFGQMEGTVFLRILEDLQHEEWTEQAETLESSMLERALVWQGLRYPFGSEMPWDSTGQEEVYAWTRHFGFDEKADITLNAILAYMPAVPHWGYNGSARRYWDFWYAGHPATSRLERQLHHYGSAMNAIPVLTEFRDHPGDFHLLRIGYAGMMGALANVTQEGFAPAAFHAYPSTLAIDGYSGDYGSGFLGHAINTASYLVRHEEFGWIGFGATLNEQNGVVTMRPTDSARMRLYVAPAGAWIELDAGKIEALTYHPDSGEISLELAAASESTPKARIRITTPGSTFGYVPAIDLQKERGAWVVDLRATSQVSFVPVED